MYKRGKLGKTKRQIRRANRGWSFSASVSSSLAEPIAVSSRIKNNIPFNNKTRKSSTSNSIWRSVSSLLSSKRSGSKRSGSKRSGSGSKKRGRGRGHKHSKRR